MKILNEIEKSRLSKNLMSIIIGGESPVPGENCSQENVYQTCLNVGIHNYINECFTKFNCPSSYFYCTGPELGQKEMCSFGYWK